MENVPKTDFRGTASKETEAHRAPETPASSKPEIPDHEIIRPIGSGAYGEVWLARNVMGSGRAVKTVYRSRFSNAEPYEREFNGIKKYEPISRSSPSLVNIFQIGRNDEEEFFYYVMELADDAYENPAQPEGRSGSRISTGIQPLIDPGRYVPDTLSRLLYDRHALPVAECVEVGLSLLDALEVLHESGLVHRDVKPSNIIFVNGAAKLADIGLITESTEAQSLVGTQGFIAPEGPNSPQGDLFSLGKVLYEASTGKDRQQFPEPPTKLEGRPDVDQLLELNAVILKASEHDSERRYRSAAAMRSDLQLIKDGYSVRRKRRRERRSRRLGRLALASLPVILVAAAIAFALKRDAPREGVLTQLATPPGWIILNDNLDSWFDISPDGSQIANARNGKIELWDRSSGIVRPLDLDTNGWTPARVRYSFDGSLLGAEAYRPQDPDEPNGDRYWTILTFKPDGSEVRRVGEIFDFKISSLSWFPDGTGMTVHSPEGRIDVSLDGRVERRPDMPLVIGARCSSYSPDGRWIALVKNEGADNRNVWILPAEGGRAIRITEWPGLDTHPTWGADSRTLYYVSSEGSENNQSWNIREARISAKSGAPIGRSRQVTRFADAFTMFPKVVGEGDQLAFVTKSKTTFLSLGTDRGKEPAEQRVLARGRMGSFSPDGDTVFFVGEAPDQKGIFRIPAGGGEPVRVFDDSSHTLAPMRVGYPYDLSPDGKTIVFSGVHEEQAGLFTVPSEGGNPRRIVELRRADDLNPVWSPDGALIAFAEDGDIFAIRADGTGRRRLASVYRWQPWTLRWSPSGDFLAALGYETPAEWPEAISVFAIARDGSDLRRLTPREEDDYKEGLRWHPDGQRLTYLRYGPADYGSENRWAYLDGSPTETFFDLPGRWDYTGLWAPDGDRFFFAASGASKFHPYMIRPSTGEVVELDGSFAGLQWTESGETMLWHNSEAHQQVWLLETY